MLLPQHIVCIQYVILFFSFCQQRLLLRTIKETKCTLPTRKNCTLCRFYYGLSTHNENAKTGHSFCYALFFMAESEGLFGVLPYSFASLRSLPRTFKQSTGLFSSAKPTVLVRIPCCLINKKIKGIANAIPFILGGE